MNPCPCPDKYPDCHKECERFDYWMREQDYAGHHEPFQFQNQQLAYRESWCSIGSGE